jgi:hypothetical protein
MTTMRMRTSLGLGTLVTVFGAINCNDGAEEAPTATTPVDSAAHASTLAPNELTGEISTQTTSQGNRCLVDPVGAVLGLRQRGDVSGFRPPVGQFGTAYPDPVNGQWHWQGIQRLPPVWNGPYDFDRSNARFMIVSSSQVAFDKDHPETTGPHFAIVHMGSRNQDGVRWRGNRIGLDAPDWQNQPNPAATGQDPIDILAQNHSVEDEDNSREYNHASSIQVLGEFLFQPLERYEGGSTTEPWCFGEPDITCQARVHIYDLQALSDPPAINTAPVLKNVVRTESRGASAVAVAELAEVPGETGKRTLMVVAGDIGSSRSLEFWITEPGLDLRNVALGDEPFLHAVTIDLYDEDACGGLPGCGAWRQGWSDYQNIALVTDCALASDQRPGGQLFLLGMTRNPDGDDVVDVFELNVTFDGSNFNADLLSDGKEGPIARRHLYCDQETIFGENQCHFDAGAGAYVDPDGRLFVYAVEHDNDGPNESVKTMEFRPEDHLDNPDTFNVEGCTDLDDSWVELYAQRLFTADGNQQSGALPSFSTPEDPPQPCCEGNARGGYPANSVGMMVDYVDRHERAYSDYDRAFEWSPDTSFPVLHNGTEAARWCVAERYKYVAFFDDGFRADQGFVILSGTAIIEGENFDGPMPLRSGCFMPQDAIVDQSGASNEASCL